MLLDPVKYHVRWSAPVFNLFTLLVVWKQVHFPYLYTIVNLVPTALESDVYFDLVDQAKRAISYELRCEQAQSPTLFHCIICFVLPSDSRPCFLCLIRAVTLFPFSQCLEICLKKTDLHHAHWAYTSVENYYFWCIFFRRRNLISVALRKYSVKNKNDQPSILTCQLKVQRLEPRAHIWRGSTIGF